MQTASKILLFIVPVLALSTARADTTLISNAFAGDAWTARELDQHKIRRVKAVEFNGRDTVILYDFKVDRRGRSIKGVNKVGGVCLRKYVDEEFEYYYDSLGRIIKRLENSLRWVIRNPENGFRYGRETAYLYNSSGRVKGEVTNYFKVDSSHQKLNRGKDQTISYLYDSIPRPPTYGHPWDGETYLIRETGKILQTSKILNNVIYQKLVYFYNPYGQLVYEYDSSMQENGKFVFNHAVRYTYSQIGTRIYTFYQDSSALDDLVDLDTNGKTRSISHTYDYGKEFIPYITFEYGEDALLQSSTESLSGGLTEKTLYIYNEKNLLAEKRILREDKEPRTIRYYYEYDQP